MKETQILVLDDEENILNSIKRIFIDEPFEIVTTTQMNEALELLQKHPIKLVMSDQRMPQASGVEFLTKVLETRPDATRILFTGYSDLATIEDAINKAHIFRFIPKPWNVEDLKITVLQGIRQFDLVVENRKLFEEMKIKNQDLEEATRKWKELFEIQKDFTSTVSHELRTPLASIKTAIDLIIKRAVGEISSDQAEVLGRAQRNVDRLKRLIDDILDLNKMEAGKLQMNFKVGDIHGAIQEVVEAQKNVAQSRGLYLKTELDEHIPPVFFDNDRIIQVLNNLLNNAIKFTKEGGITVKTQNKASENHVVVSIIDTGEGIAEENFSKLFQKFQQIESAENNEEGGTGLGLAICKEIVIRHGGKIWVESKVGQGTTFSFVLPIQERRKP
jgi:signal transduction histidine kinase